MAVIMAVAMRFAFLPLFLLVFALLALLKFLSLLLLPAVHSVHLLLLAALELVLTLMTCVLAAQFLLLLVIAPLHFLAFGVLLTLHPVEVFFVFLLQPGIGGGVVGMPRGGRPIKVAAVIFAASAWTIRRVAVAVVKVSIPTIRITCVRGTISFVASTTVVESATVINATTVIASTVFDVAAMEFARTRSRCDFGAAVIDGSPEAAIAASSFKMTVLL